MSVVVGWLFEERFDIPSAVENADDFEQILVIAEEDHVVSERETSNVGSKFGALAAESAGQTGQMAAFLVERRRKCLRGGPT